MEKSTSLQLGKSKMWLFLAAVFLINVAVMADMVIVPAVGGFFGAFGDKPELVNFIISGPALLSVLGSLIAGPLMQQLSKKTLLVAGFSIFAAASILGAAVDNVVYIAAMRAIVGLSYGILAPAAMALIAEIFIDEGQRGKIMGINNAMMAGIGAAMTLVAGFFATESWQAVYRVYWVALPILVMLFLFIPKTPPEKKSVHEDGSAAIQEHMPWSPFISLSLSYLVFNMIYSIVYYEIGVYIGENNLGDQAFIGLCSSLGTVGSAILCFLFGWIYPRLRAKSILGSYIGIALTYVALLVVKDPLVTGIACTLMGASYGFGFSYYFMQTTVVVPPTRVSSAISIITAIGGIGMFLSTYLITALQGILGIKTLTGTIPTLLAILAVGFVLSLVAAINEARQAGKQAAPITTD